MPKESVERVMTIPLRSGWSGPRQDRASRAIKVIKKHVAKHLKDQDADGDDRTTPWKEVWIDTAINLAIWARGQQHIPHFIKVKAILFEDGEIRVELAGKEEEDEAKEAKQVRGKKGAKGRRKKDAGKERLAEKAVPKEAADTEGKKEEKNEKVTAKSPAAPKPVIESKPKETKKPEKKTETKAETKDTKKPSGASSTKSHPPKKG